jgi:acyl carrier protein
MIPSAFVMLEQMPLTRNGKLDREALPAPDLDAYVTGQYEAPLGEVEEIVAEIWRTLLRVTRVGRDDNFFELGGDSLKGVQMVTDVAERFFANLSTESVFQAPTVRDMARLVNVSTLMSPRSASPTGVEDGLI